MNKPTKVLLISVFVALILTFSIILLPNSINNYYDNPEIYDIGFNYYLWKFRPIDVSMVARVTGWTFFFLHFLTVGILMSFLKKDKPGEKGMSKYNYYLLYANVFYIVLHYIHTWVWYDALAQDTPVWSSQGSVIIMLVLILIMENSRRGLFFGKKIPFPKESTRFIMKNHGIYITLAIIFTFWYHPMEFTWGHLFGFFYMFLLFIQMSMARTKVHNNMYWKAVLEVTVLFHGTFVAISQDNAPWAMFLFGFAAIFFITQIYGLKLTKKQILVSQIVFLIATLLVYSGLFTDRSLTNLEEVLRIPIIEYLLVFVFVYLIYLPLYLSKRFNIANWIKKTFLVFFILVLLSASGIVIFASSPYYADQEMYDSLENTTQFEPTRNSKSIVFDRVDYDNNIIIVPGGKVDARSYEYLAKQLWEKGHKVTIVKPFFNLAILSPNLPSNFTEEDKENIIIGHSLGGVVASMNASKNDNFDMLVLLGSYPTKELSQETLLFNAEFDGLVDKDKYDDSLKLLSDYTEIEVVGGNHAFFGYYGNQKGDGEATIENIIQQNFVANTIDQYLD